MVPRRFIIAAVVLVAVLVVGLVWSTRSRTAKVRYHRKALIDAHEAAVGRQSQGSFKRLLRRLHAGTTAGYMEEAQEHEKALVALRYFTNLNLHLSNGTVTKEFRSNFVWRIQNHFGPNSATMWRVSEDHIWILRGPSNGEKGFHATVPTNDVPEWQRIFSDCVASYATNTVPAVSK